ELLRFALAFFGSQGIGHFIMEVSDQNSAALRLLGSCGFRRCTRVDYFEVPLNFDERPAKSSKENFRLAVPADPAELYNLSIDRLPSDVRRIFDYVERDYEVAELKLEGLDKLHRRLLRTKRWFWVKDEPERGVIPCAAQVSAHREGDYHVEF